MTEEPTVEAHPDRSGVRIVDPVERAREDLYTPEPVEPTPRRTDGFYFPVDVGYAIRTSKIRVPYVVDVYVRDRDGDLVAETCNRGSVEVPPGRYNVDLSIAGVKLYLAVEAGFRVGNVDDRTEVRFDGETRVELGVRSYHDQPAGTVTVTEDPEDLMAGLSLFGSALKTTSPERSFPNLRGHPPLLELGDSFAAPDHLERPAVDVRIEVSPERERVFPVASLAYYLGAAVVPGDDPRLVAGGQAHDLSGAGSGSFGECVGQVLKQLFLLDCVTRTEGYFDVELAERRRVESLLDRQLDFAGLYDAPLAERVNRYLEVPTDLVREVLPGWRMTADVDPTPENATALPFFADKLAIVRRASQRGSASPPPQPDCISDFYRLPGREDGIAPDGGVVARGSAAEDMLDIVWPEETESFEHAWLADGVPLGANKLEPDTLRRRTGRPEDPSPVVEVTVVVNDSEMEAESSVEGIYGTRSHTPVEVDIKRDLNKASLRRLLTEPTNFVHYIGHIDERGIQCFDGFLDVKGIEKVDVEAFLLNGCRSFEQGQALVDAGATGGIVTLGSVDNSIATEVGYDLALMLNGGHSLANAARVLTGDGPAKLQYAIIGDGTAQLLRPAHGTPAVASIESSVESWRVGISLCPSNSQEIGRIYTPHIGTNETRFLNVGRIGPMVVSTNELTEYLRAGVFPVRFDGELRWSPNLVREFSNEE